MVVSYDRSGNILILYSNYQDGESCEEAWKIIGTDAEHLGQMLVDIHGVRNKNIGQHGSDFNACEPLRLRQHNGCFKGVGV
jgi:hypothetical protein